MMMAMPDREKVLRGLECCMVGDGHSPKCELCPYTTIGDDTCDSMDALFGDALALLKAQEARVMTLEELEDWDGAVFFEAFETDMYYALIKNVDLTAGMDGEYVLVNVVSGEHHRRIWGGEHYGSIWRCWTSRPTDAEREATPWNAQN